MRRFGRGRRQKYKECLPPSLTPLSNQSIRLIDHHHHSPALWPHFHQTIGSTEWWRTAAAAVSIKTTNMPTMRTLKGSCRALHYKSHFHSDRLIWSNIYNTEAEADISPDSRGSGLLLLVNVPPVMSWLFKHVSRVGLLFFLPHNTSFDWCHLNSWATYAPKCTVVLMKKSCWSFFNIWNEQLGELTCRP